MWYSFWSFSVINIFVMDQPETFDLLTKEYNTGINETDLVNCPYVDIVASENDSDYAKQFAAYFRNATSSPDSQPRYEALYNILYKKGTELARFKLPYFNDKPFSYTSEYTSINSDEVPGLWLQKTGFVLSRGMVRAGRDWMAGFGGGMQAITGENAVTRWFESFGDSHRSGKRQAAQSIKAFSRGQGAEYGTKFTLFNETPENIKKNYEFIRTFLKLLAPSYPNVMMMNVPCIFEINIPSIVKYPHGFIGNFTASPSGTSKIVEGIIAPNAWIINMTFNSLTPVSTQSLNLIEFAKEKKES